MFTCTFYWYIGGVERVKPGGIHFALYRKLASDARYGSTAVLRIMRETGRAVILSGTAEAVYGWSGSRANAGLRIGQAQKYAATRGV